MNCSMPSFPVLHYLYEFAQKLMSLESVMPFNHLVLSPPSPPVLALSASGSCPRSQLFSLGGQRIGASASASVLSMNIQGLVRSPCCSRDSQKSSPTPQFKSINPSVLSFLYSPTLTSIRDHWKKHSLD